MSRYSPHRQHQVVKGWCVTKRKQMELRGRRCFEEGKIIVVMEKGLTIREAIKLKRSMNNNRLAKEKLQFYFKADRLGDINSQEESL